jgi:anti-anti-sigma regulatory factor
VIFSLFGKKDGRGGERKRSSAPEEGRGSDRRRPGDPEPASTGGGRGADPREIARLTTAKIDEIESEMIAPQRPTVLRSPAQAGLAGTVYVPARGGGVTAASRTDLGPDGKGPARTASRAAPPPAPEPAVVAPGRGELDVNTSIILGDAGSGGSALQVIPSDSSLPPAFEEAAVLYSNGQATAAASVLWQAIQDDALAGQARQGWSLLFDLYQATGRKEDFESLAIDFSARFETSPPTWDDTAAPPPEPDPAAAGGVPAAVSLGTKLDAQSIKQLEQLQRNAQRHRTVLLDAAAVRRVDALGADLLLRVLTVFERGQRELLVQGAEALLDALAPCIEPGRRDVSEACWLLQLTLLRLLGRQQVFDDLSIDYCVTYEVSPPAWEPMPPSIRSTAAGTASAEAEASSASRAAGDGGFSAGPECFALIGELTGRAQVAFGALREYAADRAEVVIDCSRLRRVDFVAAGELLNEVVALRTGGKYLIFKDLNHVVAALLAVMGIPDLAEIRLRRQ